MPTFGSLFSGIGGFDLGLERAGWECRWQVEIDPFCRRVLARHWPHVARYGDIRALDLERLERVDLICGGFPCQPVSIAGKGLAQRDARWLWPEFARVIRALRPRYVLVENVPGLLGRGFGDVVGDLAACGYDAEWESLRADYFGVPQGRERLFLVAYTSRPCPSPIFHQDAVNAIGHSSWLYVPSGIEADVNDKDHRAGSMSLLRDTLGASIPHRERSGTDDGIPNRMDRLRGLGNAIVPQIAEWIGRRLMEHTA